MCILLFLQYDFGSPIVVDKKLIGVLSAIPECLTLKYPPVYTDIVALQNWIKETIKDNSSPSELRELENDVQYYN